MDNIIGIILSAGKGERTGYGYPKQFVEIEGTPIIAITIGAFDSIDEISELCVVIPKGFEEYFVKKILEVYKFKKPITLVTGGSTRQESSYNAVMELSNKSPDYVLIHDGVTPFVSSRIIKDSIEAAMRTGACDVAVKAIYTMIEVEDGMVERVLDRKKMYIGQTPQVFDFNIIYEAHKIAREQEFFSATDDVGLVRRLGREVEVVEGDYSNIKITNRFDFEVARTIYLSRRE